MTVPFEPLVICPALIGRAPQLETLDRLCEQAASGHGQVALIAGEAGIGKSRLVAEEVDAMPRAIFQQRCPIRSEFLSALYALTEGNPFSSRRS